MKITPIGGECMAWRKEYVWCMPCERSQSPATFSPRSLQASQAWRDSATQGAQRRFLRGADEWSGMPSLDSNSAEPEGRFVSCGGAAVLRHVLRPTWCWPASSVVPRWLGVRKG